MEEVDFEIEEGMDMKTFKANRRKLKRKEASTDAKKRGHVGKEWYNSGRTYSPDEAKSGRANMPDHERSTRKRSAIDPEAEDDNYSADKTKNPKKLRKQKAMGEFPKEEFEFWVNELVEEGYDLSDYTWEEMLDIYLDEAEGSYGATPKAYSAASKAKMTAKRKPFLKAMKSRTNPANRTSPYDFTRKGMTDDDRERARAGSKHGVGTRQDHDYPSEGPGGVTKNPKKLRKQKAMGELGEGLVTELNRAEKETGINTKTGRPTQTGGARDDKAFTSVKRMIRGMEGTPAGQRKKVPGKKPPVAGEYGAPKSPAQKVALRRAAQKRSQEMQSS
jgi:hypothetical protein